MTYGFRYLLQHTTFPNAEIFSALGAHCRSSEHASTARLGMLSLAASDLPCSRERGAFAPADRRESKASWAGYKTNLYNTLQNDRSNQAYPRGHLEAKGTLRKCLNLRQSSQRFTRNTKN